MFLTRKNVREPVPHYAPARPPFRRVLIVAPHFAPVNAPDGQRARLALPHLPASGWRAEVLTVRPEFVEAATDWELEATLPPGLRVHRVLAHSPRATRRFGWGSLARRAYTYIKERGDELLGDARFDLVFFSTSQFGVLPLGPYWRRRHGVPYVLDFHDEWAGDHHRRHPQGRPPGGRCKHAISHAFGRWQKRAVVREAAQIVSVSPRYNANLRAHYPKLDSVRLHVLPFGGAEADFERLKRRRIPHDLFQPGLGTNWVYVGRGGPTMHLAARAFFLALQRAVEAGTAPAGLRLHFIGTDYAIGDRARPTFAPLAQELGLKIDLREQTARVPHFTALQCLLDADAILLFGSDDPGYSASKLVPCLLARRPLLGIFHESSNCVDIMRAAGAGTAVTFRTGEDLREISGRICHDWFASNQFAWRVGSPSAALAPYGAAAMTSQLAAVFAAACAQPERRA
jgi:hypothetical protein